MNALAAAKIAKIKADAQKAIIGAEKMAAKSKSKQLSAANEAAEAARRAANTARAAQKDAESRLREARISMTNMAAQTANQLKSIRDRTYAALLKQKGLERKKAAALSDLNMKNDEYHAALNANNKLRSFAVIYKQVSDTRLAEVASSSKLLASLQEAKKKGISDIAMQRKTTGDARDEVYQLKGQLKALDKARKIAVARAAKGEKAAAAKKVQLEEEKKAEAQAAMEAKEAADRMELSKLKAEAEAAAAVALKAKQRSEADK